MQEAYIGSELRRDLHHGGWVVVTHDAERLAAMACPAPAPRADGEVPCSFCPSERNQAPYEITARYPKDVKGNGDNWEYRVIPARKPILAVEGDPEREGWGLYDRMRGIGAHEVLIEHPDHEARLETFGDKHLFTLLTVVQDRMRDLERDQRLRFMQFKRRFNPQAFGYEAHPHSLILAAAIIPDRLRMEMNQARQYWQFKERCVHCDILREDRKIGDRIIKDLGNVVAFVPYAASVPFEVHIFPTRHSHAFATAEPEDLKSCATILAKVWKSLVCRLPHWNLELTLDTARTKTEAPSGWDSIHDDYHWHIEIHPSPPSQFPPWTDFGGLPVCVVPPAEAAQALREALDQ